MERKKPVGPWDISLNLSICDTQEIPDTQDVLATQNLEDTQLVEATQDIQRCGLGLEETRNMESGLSEDEETKGSNTSGNDLKDRSNVPQKSIRSLKTDSQSCERTTEHQIFESTQDLPDTEELIPSQTVKANSDDLIVGNSNASNPIESVTSKKISESKENIEPPVGSVPVLQSSGSSANPESSLSGSHPASSSLSESQPTSSLTSSSESEFCSNQQDSEPSPNKSKSDGGVDNTLDATQDIYSSEEPGDTSVEPGSQEEKTPKTSSPSPRPLQLPSSGATTTSDGLFKVPQKSSDISPCVSQRPKCSRERITRRRLKDIPKGSPPLHSQDVSLLLTGSGSESDLVSPEEIEDVPIQRVAQRGTPLPETPDTLRLIVGNPTPESAKQVTPTKNFRSVNNSGEHYRQDFFPRGTVELMKNLLVKSTCVVDCKIIADRNTGDVISLGIFNIDCLAAQARQTEEPSMLGNTPSSIQSQPNGSPRDSIPNSESWKAMLANRYEEELKRALTACFKKELMNHVNSANKNVFSDRKEAFTPLKRISRKRKLSATSPNTSNVSSPTVISPSPTASPSPFKRPRLRKPSSERERSKNSTFSPIRVQPPSFKSSLFHKRDSSPKKDFASVVSPKKIPPPAPELKSASYSDFHLQPGTKVFAKWVDGKYYPAEVIRQTNAGHWHVNFYDEKEKEIPEHKICAVNTFEINQPVQAFSAQYYKKGTIVEVKSFDYKDEEFVVKLTDGSLVHVCRNELSLTEQMVQILKESAGAKRVERGFPGVDLGNVVHGKRSRSASSPRPGPAPSCTDDKPMVVTSESSSCDEFEKDSSKLRIFGIEAEVNNPDPLAGKGPRKAKGRRKAGFCKDEESLINEYGPIPEEGSNIFAGLSFVLTCAAPHQHESKERRPIGSSFAGENSDGEYLSESECYCGSFLKIKKTMSKSRLSQQITAGGGRIVTNLDSLDVEANHDDVILVANRPCHTAFFIHCLALGIKGVLFDAIIHCCKKGIVLKDYIDKFKILLDTGFSLQERRLISAWEFKNRNDKPFKITSVLVHSKDRSFIRFWEKVLRCGGATVWKLKTIGDLNYCSVIVAEAPISAALRQAAADADVPIVSYLWVIQSLIHKEALLPHSHPDFRVNPETESE